MNFWETMTGSSNHYFKYILNLQSVIGLAKLLVWGFPCNVNELFGQPNMYKMPSL